MWVNLNVALTLIILCHLVCTFVCVYICVCLCVYIYICVCTFLCVLAVCIMAHVQRISNREFKLWTFLQGTESRVATFLAETYVILSKDKKTYSGEYNRVCVPQTVLKRGKYL